MLRYRLALRRGECATIANEVLRQGPSESAPGSPAIVTRPISTRERLVEGPGMEAGAVVELDGVVAALWSSRVILTLASPLRALSRRALLVTMALSGKRDGAAFL